MNQSYRLDDLGILCPEPTNIIIKLTSRDMLLSESTL